MNFLKCKGFVLIHVNFAFIKCNFFESAHVFPSPRDDAIELVKLFIHNDFTTSLNLPTTSHLSQPQFGINFFNDPCVR